MKKKSPALIFISYARENYEQAKKIQNYLESNSQVTWLDKTNVKAGDAWEKDVRDVIKSAEFFIALLSNASLNKTNGQDRYVSLEFEIALRLHRESGQQKPHIIPVRLDEVKIPVEFEHLHCLDFSVVALEHILFSIENQTSKSPEKKIVPLRPGSLARSRFVAIALALIVLIGSFVLINWPWRSKLLFKATIFDSATNQPITGAYAYLLGPKDDTIIRTSRSGNNGQVYFELDTTGEIQTNIWYTHPQYKTVSKSIKLMAHDTYRSVRLVALPGSSDSSGKGSQPPDKSQNGNKSKPAPHTDSSNSKTISLISNTSLQNKSDVKEVIVAIATDGAGTTRQEDKTSASEVATILNKKGYTAYSSFFSSSFFTGGTFDQFYGNNFSSLPREQLNKQADVLCIGIVKEKTTPGTIDQTMLVVTVTCQLQLISLVDGKVLQQFTKAVPGTGWSEDAARQNAHTNFSRILADTLN